MVLSDPPYYTTYPNPFIEDFIKQYDKPYDQATDNYRKEPLATDVSEGKNDSICNAHSYHAKVPRKGIMGYIFHYTAPGDVVFDGFCGTSMTGVATQLCDDPNTIASLDYEVISDGIVLNENKEVISRCGTRIPILNDLSPAATLIAAGSNLTSNTKSSAWFAQKLIDNFDSEYGWMYETQDTKTGDSCLVDFILWSEVFLCPHCSGELEFWKFAYDESSGKVEDQPTCSHCSAEVSKRDLIRRTTTYYDKATQTTRTRRVLRLVEILMTDLGWTFVTLRC